MISCHHHIFRCLRFTYETNLLLRDAGWHCSWCFRTAEEVIFKMQGYSHSDRISSPGILDVKSIEKKFCTGEDPFGMLPEAISYSTLVALTYPVKMQGVSHVPHYVAKHVDRFRYLLPGGCRSRRHDQNDSTKS
jgi:beta-1,4-mannosyl-glycoprotein beta-1,4-N-acetylglucosaminyltransferase